MASVAQLKLWFARGLKPTQEQFAAWLDSFWHKNDTIPAANVEGYASILGKRISGTVINESGHLIVSLADGSSFDAGMAVGMPGTDGDNGLTPYIGGNGNWFIGTTDTGVKAEGTNGNDGYTPYIQGGYWYINGTNTGVIAVGTNGDDGISPHIGGNGNWFIGATDTGVKAEGTNGTTLSANQLQIINTIPLICSDELTDIFYSLTVPKRRFVFQTPQSFTNIVGELAVAGVGGLFTVVLKKTTGGITTTIFSTNLTFDSGENTTRTATTPFVLAVTPLAFDVGDAISVFVTNVGSGTTGRGLIIYLM